MYYKTITFTFYFLLLITANLAFSQHRPLSLAGEWTVALDSLNKGIDEKWYDKQFSQSLKLPGSTDMAQLGKENTLKDKTRLSRLHTYTGAVWYTKTIDLPKDWSKNNIELYLERCHWESQVWVNGKYIDSQNSLVAPHIYLLGLLKEGKNQIAIRIDNTYKIDVGILAHSVTEDTQTNWNGIIGKIELRKLEDLLVKSVIIYAHTTNKSVQINYQITNVTNIPWQGNASFSISHKRKILKLPTQVWNFKANENKVLEVNTTLADSDYEAWSEFTPALYSVQLKVENTSKKVIIDTSTSFGFRKMGYGSDQPLGEAGIGFTMNGKPYSVRGVLDCAIFPLTGFPPMDDKTWKKLLSNIKSYGFNHIRYHSWCPPEAAFKAADELGLSFQVESPIWTSIAEDPKVDTFFYKESERIIKFYGNHPSFCFFTSGNEPGGKNEELYQWVMKFRGLDNFRRLYSTSSGWPNKVESDYLITQGNRYSQTGFYNKYLPSSNLNYLSSITNNSVPIVTHEIGQWCYFPNIKETSKYTGVLRARNYDLIAESLKKKNMIALADSFSLASGKFQAQLYKEELEKILRTPNMGGYQMLGLQDFPGQGTSPIGLLDAFWEPKAYISKNEIRAYCQSIIPLAELPKFVFTNNEILKASLKLYHYGQEDLIKTPIEVSLLDKSDKKVFTKIIQLDKIEAGGLANLGNIEIDLSKIEIPQKLILNVKDLKNRFENSWEIWVYPKVISVEKSNIIITDTLTSNIIQQLEKGKSVLYTPKAVTKIGERQRFASIFWNRTMFQTQADSTLGLLCNPKDAIFKNFVTDYYKNWQWWDLITLSTYFNIDSLPSAIKPKVHIIDDWNKNRKLALIFEVAVGKGKLVVCGVDLNTEISQRPVARQLLHSISKYMNSTDFNPKINITRNDLKKIKI